MTISTELRKAGPFTGNGVTTAFPFPFKVFAATDVTVTRADTLGAETVLVLNTDFTVALNGDQDAAPGGAVTLAAPLSTGYRLVVSSAVPNLQPTDITNNGGFYPRVIEDALDRHVAQIQQIDEKIGRALKVAVTSPLGDQALPSPAAGMLIGWNESNDGLKNYAPIGGTLLGQQLAAANGSSLVGFQQAGAGAIVRTAQDKLRESVSVKDFGAVGDGTDESAAANAMIAAHNYLYVPPNFTLVCKNIELFNGTKVVCDGTLKLPNACSDFDRLLYAVNKTDIEIDVREIDGNYAGQSGTIGTHLIYVTGCDDISINVKYAHDHYTNSGAPTPSVDGIRDLSSGGIFLYGTDRGKITVGLFEGWSREAIQLRECRWCEISLGHAQGKYTTEYSGLQVSGTYNTVNRASVDFAGASAVGFDTRYGTLSNVIATNIREHHGVNFGHTGYPATGSVAENIVVDGAYLQGIQVSASSHDVTVNNFSIQNTGVAGISFSDGVLRGKATNGVVSYPGNWSVGVYGAELTLANVRTSDRDARVVTVNAATGLFTEGETVTTAGGSAVVRKRVQNLTGAKQRLFFTSVTGTFSVAEVMTGGTSGVTATVETVSAPVEYYEFGGGQVLRDPRYLTGAAGDQIRFPDGTAIMATALQCALTTGGTYQTFTTNYTSNIVWASAPVVTASIATVSSTNGYTVTLLRGTSTTTVLSIALNATVAQTYGVHVIAIGRWK